MQFLATQLWLAPARRSACESATGKESASGGQYFSEAILRESFGRGAVIELRVHSHEPRADRDVCVSTLQHLENLIGGAQSLFLHEISRTILIFDPPINGSDRRVDGQR